MVSMVAVAEVFVYQRIEIDVRYYGQTMLSRKLVLLSPS